MLDAVKERLDVVDFSVKIDPTNTASQGLFEELGAKPNGISKFILHDEETKAEKWFALTKLHTDSCCS